MNLPAAIYVIRWLIRDTFRQAQVSCIFWFMLGVSGLCILFCLSVGVSGEVTLRSADNPSEFLSRNDPQAADMDKVKKAGVTVVGGELTVAFGAVRIPLGRDREDAVCFLQLLLAGGVADTLGILLALLWTAGFLPTFLEPSAASVLLAKPVPRWSLLVGKYLGVLTFVAFQALIFVGGTWLALGLRTGVWNEAYLVCIPLSLLHFAVFFSVSTFIAVYTRSTVACVFGSILFWLLCWAMNYGRHALIALPELGAASPSLHFLVEACYWMLPKPADLGLILFDALHAGNHFGQLLEFKTVQGQGAFHPELSVLTSLLFTGFILAVAAWRFLTTDY